MLGSQTSAMMQADQISARYRESETMQAIVPPYGDNEELETIVYLLNKGAKVSEVMCELAIESS